MNKITLVLISLACVGHGRRLHTSLERSQRGSSAENQKQVTDDEDALDSQPLVEVEESSRQSGAEGHIHPSKKFASLLVALNPAAQYGKSARVQESPPWWERLWRIEIFDAFVQTINQGRGLSQFPIVTTLFIGLNFIGHYLQEKTLSVYEYGLLPIAVWQQSWRSWQLVASSFLHLSIEHLVADMCQLFMQGTNFEELMEPLDVLKLMVYSSIAPNAMVVLGTYLQAVRSPTEKNIAAFQTIYVDFSGALQCLFTVWRCQVMAAMGEKHSVYGIQIPIQYAFVDIIIQKVMNPEITIMREVAAITAGMLYVYVPRLYSIAARKIKKMSPVARSMLLSGVLSAAAVGLILSGQLNLAPAPPQRRPRR